MSKKEFDNHTNDVRNNSEEVNKDINKTKNYEYENSESNINYNYKHNSWSQDQISNHMIDNSFQPSFGKNNAEENHIEQINSTDNNPIYNNYDNYKGQAPHNSSTNKNKQSSNIFAILMTIFITAVVTSGLVWGLARQGVLPGTGSKMPALKDDAKKLDSLGLSIHTDDPKATKEADKLAQIVELLNKNYYKVLSDSEILAAMNKGILNSIGNPYTYYLSKEDVEAFRASIDGNYSGIGATVKMNEDKEFIINEVIENGPADKAGLKAGDKLIKIDKADVKNIDNAADLAKIVKGENGSKVKITILRENVEQVLDIVRMPVELKVVRTRMLNESIGYLNILEFTSTLPTQFKVGIEELLAQGAKDIVFDLRNNPGGSASALIDVMSMLLEPDSLIAEIKGRSEGHASIDEWKTKGERLVPENMKYAILINGNTASAAELFSGSLRDYDKAVLIGSKSFGKGSGTSTYNLLDGSAANITVFNYYLPKGDLIEGKGLEPDIESEGPNLDALKEKSIYELSPEDDPDLKKALEYLSENK